MRKTTTALLLTAMLIASASALAATTTVATSDEATKAIATAQPGDEILIVDGIHTDFRVTLQGKGTKDRPIVLRAANPGKAVLTGKALITITGEHLVVRDLVFDQAWGGTAVAFRGATQCLLTDCAFIECGHPKSPYSHAVSFAQRSHHNLAQRCYMQANLSMGMGVSITKGDFENTHNRVAWNHFKDIVRRSHNGQEAVQIGQGGLSDRTAQYTIVEHNLFERASGDAEIISSKSSWNILRHNTVRECKAMFVLRGGNHTRVESNYFFNGSGGVRAYGAGHQIIGNYIQDCDWGVYIPSGVVTLEGTIAYAPFIEGVVAFNTIVNCSRVGLQVVRPDTHAYVKVNLPLSSNDFLKNIVVTSKGEPVRDEGSYNSTWRGNIVHTTGAAKTGYEHEGILRIDPKLEQRDGLWRPASDSPAIDPPGVDFRNVNAPVPGSATDIDGQPRDAKPDAGCDEASKAPVRYPPLTAKDVGPQWLRGDVSRIQRIPSPKPIPKIMTPSKAKRRGKEPHVVPMQRAKDGTEITVQVEDFRLVGGAEIQKVEGAVGGKAVMMKTTSSQAEASVPLEVGTYRVELHTRSNGSDEDAIILSLAGRGMRSYRPGTDFGPTNRDLIVIIKKGGPQDLIVMVAETGVLADQIVIRRIKK